MESQQPAAARRGTGRVKATASLFAKLVSREQAATAAQRIVEKAVGGDVAAARFMFDRLDPKPRGRLIALDVPRDADLGAACAAVLAALVAGRMTADEAFATARALEQLRKTAAALAAAAPPEPELIGPHNNWGDDLDWGLDKAPAQTVEPPPAEPPSEPPDLFFSCNLQVDPPPTPPAPTPETARPPAGYARPLPPGGEPAPPRRRRARRRLPGTTAWSA